eukprot:7889845-Ditylum_brightwellii.AAC.1
MYVGENKAGVKKLSNRETKSALKSKSQPRIILCSSALASATNLDRDAILSLGRGSSDDRG